MDIYPNPASSVLNVNLNNQKASVSLMEITGKIIETKEVEGATQFNLKGLATGVYFAKVRTEKETVIFRVLVN